MIKHTERNLTRLAFADWDDYLGTASNESARVWSKRDSITGGFGFTGTNNFADAVRIAREGWPEGRALITEGVQTANTIRATIPTQSRSYDVGGAYPDVPLFVAGDPAHMVNPEPIQTAVKHVFRVLINFSAAYNVTRQAIINRGAAILSHVDALEQAGHRVEMLACQSVNRGDYHFESLIEIKRASEQWEPDRMAFVLAHPSMLRRLHFCVYEQQRELLAPDFPRNYGFPCEIKDHARPGSVYFGAITGNDGRAGAWGTMQGALEIVDKAFREGFALSGADAEPAP